MFVQKAHSVPGSTLAGKVHGLGMMVLRMEVLLIGDVKILGEWKLGRWK